MDSAVRKTCIQVGLLGSLCSIPQNVCHLTHQPLKVHSCLAKHALTLNRSAPPLAQVFERLASEWLGEQEALPGFRDYIMTQASWSSTGAVALSTSMQVGSTSFVLPAHASATLMQCTPCCNAHKQ